MTSRRQAARYYRRYGRELVSKPPISLKNSWGRYCCRTTCSCMVAAPDAGGVAASASAAIMDRCSVRCASLVGWLHLLCFLLELLGGCCCTFFFSFLSCRPVSLFASGCIVFCLFFSFFFFSFFFVFFLFFFRFFLGCFFSLLQ